MDTPPERLVTTGPYAYTRNPMFHFRVRRDEKRLRERFGQAYIGYQERVKRWLPGIF